MLRKHFSIVIIPRRTKQVRKIRIPVFLFGIFGLLLAGLLSVLAYIVVDYFNLRSELASMEEKEIIQVQQEKKIEDYNRRFRDMQLHFNHLNTLNNKLKSMVITSMDTERKSRLRKQDKEALEKMYETARKSSVLDVIVTESSEADSDLIFERGVRSRNLIEFFKKQQNPYARIPSGLPVTGYLVEEFGLHADPYTGQMRPQNGIDIASRLDVPIIAPADGIVIETKQEENFGRVLVIDHGNGFKTIYGHIADFEVEVGDLVRKGTMIAQVGNTGRVTGPRLYYEVQFNEIPQNPVKYLYD